MSDYEYNQTEEEWYAAGGEVCACCGSLDCEFTVDDSVVRRKNV